LPILSLLGNVAYFADLDPAVLRVIAPQCRLKVYSAGQIVFMEGDPCLDLCILESGRVLFSRVNAEGREQVLKVFERPGDTFCIPSAFSAGRHIVTVKAGAETRLHLLGVEAVNRLVGEHPSVGLKLIATAGEHMTHLVTLAQDLALKTATARLASYLLGIVPAETAAKDEPLRIPRSRLREDDLASSLGTVRVNVSRSLKNLVRAGAIEMDRTSIRVVDPAALRRISEGK
jgi:CRP/FNR family transcriptional regulator, cyclic AMP receptor protein